MRSKCLKDMWSEVRHRVYCYLLHTLAGDDELHAGVGEDGRHMALSGRPRVLFDDAWPHHLHSRYPFKHRHHFLGRFCQRRVFLPAF